MKNRVILRKLLALFMASAMILEPSTSVVETYAQEIEAKALQEQQLKEWAAGYAKAFPDGGYEFLEEEQEVAEDSGDIAFTVVRKGDTSRADTVEIKAVDVTAYYGSDYRMYVKENGTFVEVGEEQEDSAGHNTEEAGSETDVGKSTEPVSTENADITPATEESGSMLKKIKAEEFGITEERVGWREQIERINDAKAVAASMEAENELINAANGHGAVLEFAEGEFKKEVRIEIIDDDYSESDESAWIGLGNAKIGMMAENSQIKINIKDNEAEESITFAMKSAEVVVTEGESTAKVTIERTTGIHSYAVVTVNTSAGSAQPNEDYLPMNQKQVVFPAEVTEQTVEIALLGDRTEASQFVVKLDDSDANVEEGKDQTIVTIVGGSENEVQTQAQASYSWCGQNREGSYTIVSYNNFVEYGGNEEDMRYGMKYYGFGSQLKAAEKMHVDYNMHGKSKTGAIWYYDKEISLDIGEQRAAYRSVSDKKYNDSVDGSWDITLNSYQHQQSMIRQNAYTGWWNNTCYMKIKQMDFYMPDYSISFDNSKATYYPVTYTNTKNGQKSTTAVTLGETRAAGTLSYAQGMSIGVSNLNSGAYIKEYQIYLTNDPHKQVIKTLPSWDTYMLYSELVDIWNDCNSIYKVLGRAITIRPVYALYPAMVKFTSKDEQRATYASNTFKNGEVLNCTMLDKVKVEAKGAGQASQGLKVSSIRLRGAHTWCTTVDNATLDNVAGYAGEYQAVKSTAGGQTSLSSTLDIDRNYNIIEIMDQESTLKVYYDQKELNHEDELSGKLLQNMGSVILSEGQAASSSTAKKWTGDWQSRILLSGVRLEQPYMLSAITEDGGEGSDIKTNWTYKDTNGIYQTVRGNNFVFRPYYTDTDIEYFFERVQRNKSQENLSGTVKFKEKPLFTSGNCETITTASNVDLNIGGQSVKTDKDGNYTTEKVFNKGEVVGIYLEYGEIYQLDTINMSKNRQYNPIVDINENDGITFDSCMMTKIFPKKNGGVAGGALNALGAFGTYEDKTSIFYLEDNTYTMKMNLSGRGCQPAGVELKVYNSKGELKSEFTRREKVVNGKEVTFKINPTAVATATGVTKKLDTGDYITMTAYDTTGKLYFEHHTNLLVTKQDSSMYMFNYNAWESDTDNLFVKAMGNLSIGYDAVIDLLCDDLGTYEDTKGNNHQLYGFGFGKGFSSLNSEISYEENAYTKQQKVIQEIRSVGTSDEKFDAHDEFALSKDAKEGTWALEIEVGVIMDTVQGTKYNGKNPGQMYFNDYIMVGKASVSYAKYWSLPLGVVDVEFNLAFKVKDSGIAWHFWAEDDTVPYTQVKDSSKPASEQSTIMQLDACADTSEGTMNVNATIEGEAKIGKSGVAQVDGKVTVSVESHNALRAKKWYNTGVVTISPEVALKLSIIKIPIWKNKYHVTWGLDDKASLADAVEEAAGKANMLEVSAEHPAVISRDYLNHESAWLGTDVASLYSIDEASGVSRQDLKEGLYSEAQIALQDVGNGKYLAIIVDDDKERDEYNRGAIYYSLSEDKGATWSQPVLLDEDGTLDQLPSIQKAGRKGYMVAWTDAGKAFAEGDSSLDLLNSYNISAKFFDPDTMTFGEKMAITKNTAWDNISDTNPQVVYVEADSSDHVDEQLMVYYTKSEYVASDSQEEVTGDILHPADTIVAYRTYDFENDKWVDTYSKPDSQEGYTENMYGQQFLNLAPVAKVTEEMDPQTGYWKAGTTAQVEAYDGPENAVVTDTAGIGYNHLSLLAYVLDEDGETITSKEDKNIYLQIHNFKEDTTHHPILITTERGNISNLQFVRTELGTYLYWLQDGEIYKQDISSLVKNNLQEVTVQGQSLYIVDRSEPSDNEKGYEDPILVATMDNTEESTRPQVEVTEDNQEEIEEVLHSLEEEDTEDADVNPEAVITSFTTKAQGDYIYTVWTGQKAIAKENEASQFENQIYVCRENVVGQNRDKEEFDTTVKCYESTMPVQVTSEENDIFADQDFVVAEDGSMCAMANLFQYDAEAGEIDETNGTLTVLSFNPKKAVTIKEAEIGTIYQEEADNVTFDSEVKEAKWQLPVTLTIENSSVEKITGATVSVSGSDEEIEYSAIGGEKKSVVVSLPVDAKGNYSATVTIKDGDNALATKEISGKVDVDLSIHDFKVALNERNQFDISANVTNTYGITSEASTVTFGYLDEEGNEVCLKTFDVEALASGEQQAVTQRVEADFDKIFGDSVLDDEGNYISNRKFFLKSNAEGEPVSYCETGLKLTKEQMETMQQATSIEPELSRTIKVGEAADTFVKVNGEELCDPAFEGLKIMWNTDQNQVVEVNPDGSVIGLKAGTTELTGYVMPDNTDHILDENCLGIEVDNYPTMPNDAIRAVTMKVTVAAANKTPTTPVKISNTKVSGISGKSFTYTGKYIKPSITITYKGKKLKLAKDYKVTFISNKKIGKATAVITGIGNYSGTRKVNFTIIPAKVKANVLTVKGKKQLVWKKVSGATGYAVYYSTKKNSGYKKLGTTKSQKIAIAKSKKLKAGKTYYFKVKAYGKNNSRYYYGGYSGVHKCKVPS